jgi:hypothetical protein
MRFIATATALRAAIAAAPATRSAPVAGPASPTPAPCHCALGPCAGWESMTEDRWPAEQMAPVGTLRDPEAYEPTFEEHHPGGTRYDSPDAPVAVRFFPYNRCDVWRCSVCQRHLMRYTEFGGYYVDHRVRALQPDQIVDP